jgi:integrase
MPHSSTPIYEMHHPIYVMNWTVPQLRGTICLNEQEIRYFMRSMMENREIGFDLLTLSEVAKLLHCSKAHVGKVVAGQVNRRGRTSQTRHQQEMAVRGVRRASLLSLLQPKMEAFNAREQYEQGLNSSGNEYRERELASFGRDELQDLFDGKAEQFSYSTVDHLRWDLRQIFDIAIADGHLQRNAAALIFTPKEAAKPDRKVMTVAEVQACSKMLGQRERLIAKLAILAGMRPGEIFALTWGAMNETYANIRQRIYKGIVVSPKTAHSQRKAALSAGLLEEIEAWRQTAVTIASSAWVFPSERMTPLAKENVWRQSIQPKLAKVGLEWVNFQVMRRTHASLMNGLGVEGKLVADQLGHSLDVNQNLYTQSPVANRQVAVNQLEKSLRVM